MRDFIAGLFPHLQARYLRTRHGSTQPRTLSIDKHGNKSFVRHLKCNVDVINLLLNFNFLLFTYAHLIQRHNININIMPLNKMCIREQEKVKVK